MMGGGGGPSPASEPHGGSAPVGAPPPRPGGLHGLHGGVMRGRGGLPAPSPPAGQERRGRWGRGGGTHGPLPARAGPPPEPGAPPQFTSAVASAVAPGRGVVSAVLAVPARGWGTPGPSPAAAAAIWGGSPAPAPPAPAAVRGGRGRLGAAATPAGRGAVERRRGGPSPAAPSAHSPATPSPAGGAPSEASPTPVRPLPPEIAAALWGRGAHEAGTPREPRGEAGTPPSTAAAAAVGACRGKRGEIWG